MTPDIKLNGTSVASMGWLRETVSFPVPQSQSNTIVVPGRSSPIRYTEALGRVSYQPRSFSLTFSIHINGSSNKIHIQADATVVDFLIQMIFLPDLS